MFDAKDEVEERLTKVLSLIYSQERGVVIPIPEFERVTGLEWTDNRMRYVVLVKARARVFRETGATLESVPGVGMYRATERQQLRLSTERRMRKAYRQVAKGVKEIGGIVGDGLTEHERVFRARAMEAMRERKLQVGRTARTIRKTRPRDDEE